MVYSKTSETEDSYHRIGKSFFFIIRNCVVKNSKVWDDSFIGFSAGFVMVYSIFSDGVIFKEKFANQNGHFLTFWDNLTFWNKGNFVVKNLCDEVSKIKNLSWQFRCIFRRLCHGVLHFFCKYFFHGEIFKTKWPLFILFGEFWYFEIKETLWLKISVTKFQKSKIWVDSFVGFSIGFVVV